MSDFGFWELALIMLIALLVVGPERLPQLLATIGRWMSRIKRLTTQLKTEFAEQASANEVKKILSDAQDTINQAGSDIKREFMSTDSLTKAVEKQIDEGRFVAHDTDDDNTTDPHSKRTTEATKKEK
ncbi:MAG: twin-arginine translocase subunit TatB [Chromatiales bacterium]|nr:twin-arginine translocase subunit TatB [Chromatiales bacterium]